MNRKWSASSFFNRTFRTGTVISEPNGYKAKYEVNVLEESWRVQSKIRGLQNFSQSQRVSASGLAKLTSHFGIGQWWKVAQITRQVWKQQEWIANELRLDLGNNQAFYTSTRSWDMRGSSVHTGTPGKKGNTLLPLLQGKPMYYIE